MLNSTLTLCLIYYKVPSRAGHDLKVYKYMVCLGGSGSDRSILLGVVEVG